MAMGQGFSNPTKLETAISRSAPPARKASGRKNCQARKRDFILVRRGTSHALFPQSKGSGGVNATSVDTPAQDLADITPPSSKGHAARKGCQTSKEAETVEAAFDAKEVVPTRESG